MAPMDAMIVSSILATECWSLTPPPARTDSSPTGLRPSNGISTDALSKALEHKWCGLQSDCWPNCPTTGWDNA